MDRKNLDYLFVLLVLVIVNLVVSAQSVTAPKTQAQGVDFILLIDESGSMGGSAVHPGQNDPLNKRNAFIKFILKGIFDASQKRDIFRISVIEFGSRFGTSKKWKAQVTLPAYKVPDPRPTESESNYKKRVYGELQYLFSKRNRGDSDHEEALRLAEAEINRLSRHPVPVPLGKTGVEKRLKVVFMITDGRPYVKTQSGQVLDDGRLKREIERTVGNFPPDEAILYVFGLNADDDYWYKDGYGTFWRDVAATTTDDKGKKGDAQFITYHKKIYEQIYPILQDYFASTGGGGVKIIENKYDCPPYLSSVEFIIEFSRSHMKLEDTIVVKQPGPVGAPIPYAYFKSEESFARVKVDYPVPGIWTFERKKEVRIMVEEKPGTAGYVSPVSPIGIGRSEHVVFKIHGRAPNQVFTPLPAYPLEGRIDITAPDKSEYILNAEPDPGRPGHFKANTPYKFDQQGTYNIQFSGSVITASGEKEKVIESGIHEAAVINSHPVKVVLEKPGALSSTFGSVEEPVTFAFYSRNQQIPIDKILKAKPTIESEFVMVQASGKISETQTIPLEYEDGMLTGKVKGKIPWRYLPELLAGKIKGKLTLKMDNRILKQDYFLEEPGTLSQLYEFTPRIGEPFWIYLLIIVIFIALFFIIPYFLFYKKKAAAISKDVPVLIYRHGDKFNPDTGVEKRFVVFKRKITLNKGVKTPFEIPGLSTLWEPQLTVVRHPVPDGVKISVKYERFNANKKDKERFEEAVMETRDNDNPDQHRIIGLEQHDMIFELKIKEEDR